uniref:Uncharacterized protein n=1 Tax=Acrobeloides nanus TaxID=290746 RepID=A0A914D9U8_9BILA
MDMTMEWIESLSEIEDQVMRSHPMWTILSFLHHTANTIQAEPRRNARVGRPDEIEIFLDYSERARRVWTNEKQEGGTTSMEGVTEIDVETSYDIENVM